MSFIEKIRALNDFAPQDYLPFMADGIQLGWVMRAHLGLLKEFPGIFNISDRVEISPGLRTCEEKSAAIAAIVPRLSQSGIFSYPVMGELYPAIADWGQPALFRIERNATIFFGLRVYGVHINGYVRKADGIHIWVQKRSSKIAAWPGMLDQMIAGGQPAGLSVGENVIKEGGEEAGFGPAVMKRACPAGLVSYAQTMREGIRRDNLFIYDLELREDETPTPDADEVESFELLPWQEVARISHDESRFKPNCVLCNLDFMMRHGLIDADGEPGYCEWGRLMRL